MATVDGNGVMTISQEWLESVKQTVYPSFITAHPAARDFRRIPAGSPVTPVSSGGWISAVMVPEIN